MKETPIPVKALDNEVFSLTDSPPLVRSLSRSLVINLYLDYGVENDLGVERAGARRKDEGKEEKREGGREGGRVRVREGGNEIKEGLHRVQ